MIVTPRALDEVVDRVFGAEMVALDTEFVMRSTYYAKLGLIQVGFEGGHAVLIDPLAVEDLRPLGAVLSSKRVTKVFHSPETDLVLLHEATGAVPRNVVDTQRSAGLVGHLHTLSLAKLLQTLLNVTVKKTETRSDWLSRPLTPTQRRYAAQDVQYLCAAYRQILSQIAALGREAWLEEEMGPLQQPSAYTLPKTQVAYLRFGGARILPGRNRAVLQAVAAWREEQARRKNVPRNYILSKKAVEAVARRVPRTARQLRQIRAVPKAWPHARRVSLLRAVQSACDMRPEDYPPKPRKFPKDSAFQARCHIVAAHIAEQAAMAGVSAGLVATKTDIKRFVAGHPSPLRTGWRYELIGSRLQDLLQSTAEITVDTGTGAPGKPLATGTRRGRLSTGSGTGET